MNENFKKALEYITKRKKLISKKLDKDQQSLELLGEYQSSDKQWFGWCDEFDILSYIETALTRLEKLEEAIRDLFANHIEFVAEEDKCYFKIKNSKGKEKSFSSKTFEDFWKEVFKVC